jgi:putative addiction module killer protein
MKCTSDFLRWIVKLDRSLAIRIDQRLQRFEQGNPGLHKRFDNVLEIKWSKGTMGSFRIYCADVEGVVILLGGHKDTQSKDIKLAKQLLTEVKNGKIRIEKYE